MKSQTMSGSLIAYKIVLAMNYEKAEFIAIECIFFQCRVWAIARLLLDSYH